VFKGSSYNSRLSTSFDQMLMGVAQAVTSAA
jgi:hypothetical protein